MTYKAETTQFQRAELLDEVKKQAHGPGIDMLRAVLRDLDRAEAIATAAHEWLHHIVEGKGPEHETLKGQYRRG